VIHVLTIQYPVRTLQRKGQSSIRLYRSRCAIAGKLCFSFRFHPKVQKSSTTMMSDHIGPNLNIPGELIRLASAVHRFRCPVLGSKKLSYSSAFKTSSAAHSNTMQGMQKVCTILALPRSVTYLSEFCLSFSL
jgi:hypothetical protein